jgi:branched-chain amino acid transport system permease protein
MINSFLNALILGTETGCIYAVIALGLSIIFGVIRVVNFAHGTILMLSLYLSFYLFKWFKIEPYLSAVIAAGAAFVFGYVVQFIVVRPIFVREKAYVVEPLGVLMLMAGVDMILSSLGIILFTPYVKSVRSVFSVMTFNAGFSTLSISRMVPVPVAVILAILSSWLLNRTETGNIIRAVGQNRDAAAACGVNVHHIYALTFGIGCAVTAFGGNFLLPFYPITPTIGSGLTIKAFIVVVLGGMGSIYGMLAAGVIVGLIESISSMFMPGSFATLLALAVFIVIIVVKPSGLMGRRIRV